MISTTDDHMGRILAGLERNGLTRDTIVVFMSDNGHSAEDAWIRKPDHRSGLPEGTYYGAHGGGGNTGRWRGNLAEPEPERTNHLEQRPDLVRRLVGLHEMWVEELRPRPQP